MQGLGFASAVSPVFEFGTPGASEFLARHLQRFHTHPYLAAPIIGSVTRLEAENRSQETAELKNALMGPYAAIGDSFFWGALKPFSGIAAVCLAIKGSLLAPLILLALYSPVHFWVRIRGFLAGWQQGKMAIEFVRGLDLPAQSRRIRWCSAVLLGVAGWLATAAGQSAGLLPSGMPGLAGGLLVILASFLAVRKGLPPLAILYGSVTLFTVMMSL
jgi:PTS system mannose-specific IID component